MKSASEDCGSGGSALFTPAAPAVYLVNQISGHGHLDMYARLYSAAFLKLGYRVVLISGATADIAQAVTALVGAHAERFFYFSRTELYEQIDADPLKPRASELQEVAPGSRQFPPLLVRARRVWREEGMHGIVQRILLRGRRLFVLICARTGVSRALRATRALLWRIDLFAEAFTPFHGVRFLELVWEIQKAQGRSGVGASFVFFLYLDMISDWRASRRALNNNLTAPWSGILFHPRARQGGRAKPERYFFSRNSRGAAFLNPHHIERYKELFPTKRFTLLPDVTDTETLPATSALMTALKIRAAGRPIVLLIGSLSPRKGLLSLIEIIQNANPIEFCFAIIGEIFWSQFGEQENALRAFVAAPPENCFTHTGYLADDREVNSVIAMADILFATYKDFPDSSNSLTKASVFEKPIVVSEGYLMGERVRQYRLGSVVPYGDAAKGLAALRYLISRDKGSFGFADYRSHHSLDALTEKLSEHIRDCGHLTSYKNGTNVPLRHQQAVA